MATKQPQNAPNAQAATAPKLGASFFDFPHSARSPLTVMVVPLLSWLSTIPVIFYLVKPGGIVERLLVGPSISFLRKATSNSVAQTKDGEKQMLIVGTTVLYLVTVYTLSGIMSVVGQSMGTKSGYKNKEPRHSKHLLGPGLPHRMVSTHEALYDIFPAYAVTASILYATSASGSPSAVTGLSVPMESLNALVLHVFLKLFVYAPAYLADLDTLRSAAHLHAMAALPAALVYLLL